MECLCSLRFYCRRNKILLSDFTRDEMWSERERQTHVKKHRRQNHGDSVMQQQRGNTENETINSSYIVFWVDFIAIPIDTPNELYEISLRTSERSHCAKMCIKSMDKTWTVTMNWEIFVNQMAFKFEAHCTGERHLFKATHISPMLHAPACSVFEMVR